jgi:hypothetical protein
MDRGPVRHPDRGLPGELSPLDRYLAELNERLVVHRTGGVWRVPLGTRSLAVHAADGRLLGRVVCGDGRDAARAAAALAPAAAPGQSALAAALAGVAPLLAALAALEPAPSRPGPPAAVPTLPPGAGPVLISTPAGADPAALARMLAAAAPRGAVWRPDPRAAASAHLLAAALGPLLGAALALIHGDDATLGALAAAGLSPAGAAPGRP